MTAAAMIAAAGCMILGPASAQPGGTPRGAGASEKPGAVVVPVIEPPDAAATLAAFGLVESWLRSGQTPEPADAANVTPSFAAASVTLRMSGGVLGRGTRVAPDPPPPPARGQPAPAPLPPALWSAAVEAIGEARRRLPAPNDALRELALVELARTLTVSVELAGTLVPITPDSYEQVSVEVAPGLEGVAVRIGERIAAMFPGTMLASNVDPGRAAAALVSRVAGDAALSLESPQKLRETRGAVFYKFRVTHAAQVAAGLKPEILFRGGRVVRRAELTTPALVRWADDLAGHLLSRRTTGGGDDPTAIAGVFNPATATSESAATRAQLALLAIAMERYAGTPGVSADVAQRAERWSVKLRTALAGGGRDPADDVALALEAVAQQGSDPALAALLATRAEADFASAQGGVVALGMAWAAQTEEERSAARAAVRSVFRQSPPGQLVARMPWLGWAELKMTEPGADVPSAVALREMRDLVFRFQITPEDAGADTPDLAGGIVFTKGPTPLPTWQSVRPLAFIATMLGDERLTADDEVARELTRLLASLRFLRQLTADEAVCHMFADRGRSIGGVRSSLWDQRMSLDATALTLLTVTETLRSMEAISARRAGAGER